MSDILDAVCDYIEAKRELDECRERAGMESGYFCHGQRQAVERAEERFERALSEFVNEHAPAIRLTND